MNDHVVNAGSPILGIVLKSGPVFGPVEQNHLHIMYRQRRSHYRQSSVRTNLRHMNYGIFQKSKINYPFKQKKKKETAFTKLT